MVHQRHPINPNLTIYREDCYLDIPIMFTRGPFILENLDTLYRTMNRALDDYRRVFAFRFDLHFPSSMPLDDFKIGNEIIDRFIESFKAKTAHNLLMRSRKRYTPDTVVRYAWARELSQRSWPHYHFAMLLNNDAFFTIGEYKLGRDNIYNRIVEAWASALRIKVEDAQGLLHMAKNSACVITRGDEGSFSDFFHRASYICKAPTKDIGNRHHSFGASRV